jgi:hypothetical protein
MGPNLTDTHVLDRTVASVKVPAPLPHTHPWSPQAQEGGARGLLLCPHLLSIDCLSCLALGLGLLMGLCPVTGPRGKSLILIGCSCSAVWTEHPPGGQPSLSLSPKPPGTLGNPELRLEFKAKRPSKSHFREKGPRSLESHKHSGKFLTYSDQIPPRWPWKWHTAAMPCLFLHKDFSYSVPVAPHPHRSGCPEGRRWAQS